MQEVGATAAELKRLRLVAHHFFPADGGLGGGHGGGGVAAESGEEFGARAAAVDARWSQLSFAETRTVVAGVCAGNEQVHLALPWLLNLVPCEAFALAWAEDDLLAADGVDHAKTLLAHVSAGAAAATTAAVVASEGGGDGVDGDAVAAAAAETAAAAAATAVAEAAEAAEAFARALAKLKSLASADPATPQRRLLRALLRWHGLWTRLADGSLPFTVLDRCALPLLADGDGGAEALSCSAPTAMRHVVGELASPRACLPRFIWPTGAVDGSWCAELRGSCRRFLLLKRVHGEMPTLRRALAALQELVAPDARPSGEHREHDQATGGVASVATRGLMGISCAPVKWAEIMFARCTLLTVLVCIARVLSGAHAVGAGGAQPRTGQGLERLPAGGPGRTREGRRGARQPRRAPRPRAP